MSVSPTKARGKEVSSSSSLSSSQSSTSSNASRNFHFSLSGGFRLAKKVAQQWERLKRG